MSEKQFDAVVIGAGVGGLISGALLAAMEGMKVLVLEKMVAIGGRCTSVGKQHGSDYSASEYEQLLREGQYTTVLRSEPDTSELIKRGLLKDYIIEGWHAMSGGDRCRYGLLARTLGKRLHVSNSFGFAYWRDGRWAQLPEIAKEWSPESATERERIARERMRLTPDEAAEFDHIDVKSYLESVTDDQQVRDYYNTMAIYQLGENDTARTSAGQWIKCNNGTSAMGRHLIHGGGLGEVTGGFKTVADTFASVILENGGEIRTSQLVKEIVIKKWKAEGVVVQGKTGAEEIRATHVICNVPVYGWPQLIPEQYFPSELRQRIKGMRPGAVATGINICLREPLETEHPTSQYILESLPGTATPSMPNGRPMLFEQTSLVDPTRAPKGQCLMTASAYREPEETSNAELEQLCNRIMEFLRRQYPRLDDIVEWYRFGRADMVWGVAATVDCEGDRRFPVKHPTVRNLFFTGDCVQQWDVGTNGAAHGAVLCVSALTGRDYLKLFPPAWR